MRWVRLKHLAEINSRTLSESTAPDFRFRYIDITAVDSSGRIKIPDSTIRFDDAPSRARRMALPGDTIVSTVRTYLRAIGPAPRHQDPLIFSTGFAILGSNEGLDARYLTYFCQSEQFLAEVASRSTGVSYPAIISAEIGNIPVPVPALDEQRRIANFLDAELIRVESLEGAIQRQVSLLAERWTVAALERAWPIGVPHRRLGYATLLITSGSRAWADYVGDDGSPFIRSANLRRDSIELNVERLARVSLPESARTEARRSQIEADDVLVGITGANTGWIGLAGDAVIGGNVSQHVCLIRPSRAELNCRWLAYLLSSRRVQEALAAGQYGGTKTQLSLPDIRDLRIPVVPLDVQVAISTAIRSELAAAGRRKAARLRQLALIAERKRALITAAVTGQIDVTTARGVDVT